MKLRLTAVIAAVAAGALATSAMAAEPVLAKLSAAGKTAKPVAGGAVFECLGDVCAARTPSADTSSVRGCKELVRQVGAVSSYGAATKPLAAEQLASCNESAKK